ncbi:MAG: hypothetical protein USCGTAYLOR_02846 [Chromatiales bacterium USCg_Taylor]|nr:MAG: hypothetical protein USCGTAYLOR_02846 [Chromatiales bacterium USCg_Taylor]
MEKDNLALTLARKAYYPDFEVSISRFENFDARDGVGVMVSASIPLAYKYKYDAAVDETTANRQAAQSELWRVRDLALFEVKQAFVGARTALEQVNLFLYTHVPQAEQALQASQAVEQVHLEHLTAAANFEKSWAELERAVGQELPRTVLSEIKRDRGAGPERASPRGRASSVLSGPVRHEQKGTCEARPKGECRRGHSSTKPASHARREAAEGRRGLRPEARYAKP